MMEVQRTSSQEEGREDYTEILPYLTQRICFIDEQGQEREFAQFPLLIGRGADCGWVIPNKNISRHHAEVIFSLEAYSIQDLKSLNGVRVNGFKVDRVVLEDGDQVSLGELRFTFHLRKASDPRSVNHRFSPSLEEETVSPVNTSQSQASQKDNLDLDLDLDDLYTPEVELEAEMSEALLESPTEKKWWPALLAVFAAATVAAALVAVAYYFLQPSMGGGLMSAEQKEMKSVVEQQKPIVQQQAMPQKMPEVPVLVNQNQATVVAMQISNAQQASDSETDWSLGPGAQSPSIAMEKSVVVQKPSVPVVSSATRIPLPGLAEASLDLPESVRSTLSQANKVNRAIEKKIVSPAVANPVISAQANNDLSDALRQFYLAGDEAQLAMTLEQVARKSEVSGGRSRELLTLHQTVSRLLTLYRQAEKSYQAGDKAQAFSLWAQFLGKEKAWLGQQRSAYAEKVGRSVMNEYLVRAQAASAAGNQVLAGQYREKAEALAPKASRSFPRMKKAAVTPVSVEAEKTMASTPVPAYSSADVEALYQKGLRLEYSNLEQAILLWRQVTQAAPKESDVYAKASAKLAWYDKWKTTTQ